MYVLRLNSSRIHCQRQESGFPWGLKDLTNSVLGQKRESEVESEHSVELHEHSWDYGGERKW